MSHQNLKVAILAILLPVAMLLTVNLTLGQDEETKEAKPLTIAQKQFAKLKTLVGDWVTVDEEGNPTDEVASRISITAGGSAIMDIEFPGTDHEMITLYHLDGDDLILAHYCVMQNQPQMKAVPSEDLSKIVFKCTTKGTNMKSENDAHMHEGTFAFVDENHLKSTWNMLTDGVVTYVAAFDLVRVKK